MQLATKVGYTHPASLANVKNFENLWRDNERRLAGVMAERERRLKRPDR